MTPEEQDAETTARIAESIRRAHAKRLAEAAAAGPRRPPHHVNVPGSAYIERGVRTNLNR